MEAAGMPPVAAEVTWPECLNHTLEQRFQTSALQKLQSVETSLWSVSSLSKRFSCLCKAKLANSTIVCQSQPIRALLMSRHMTRVFSSLISTQRTKERLKGRSANQIPPRNRKSREEMEQRRRITSLNVWVLNWWPSKEAFIDSFCFLYSFFHHLNCLISDLEITFGQFFYICTKMWHK